jgi:hypothetical protein
MWETDNDGNPRDPWQFTNHLVLANPDDGQIYTFVTSSKGGLNALGVLCKQYGQAMRQRPNEWPIVELGMGSYAHRDKSRGRIKHPTFKIVGWAPKDGNDVTPSPAEPPPIPKTSNTADAVRRF